MRENPQEEPLEMCCFHSISTLGTSIFMCLNNTEERQRNHHAGGYHAPCCRALGIREARGATAESVVLLVQSPKWLRAGPWVVLQNLQCSSNGPVSSIEGLDMLRALVSLSQSGKSVIEVVKACSEEPH